MKYLTVFILFSSFFILQSCKTENVIEFTNSSYVEIDQTEIKVFSLSHLLYFNQHILLVDNQRDTRFTIINTETMESRKFGVKGKGPDEFLYIGDAYNDFGNQKIIIEDTHKKILHRFDYDSLILGKIGSAEKMNIPKNTPLYTAIRHTNNGWIYGDLTGEAMVTIIGNNEEISHMDFQPKLPYSLNPTTKAYAYYSAIDYNAKENKTIVALRYFPFIYILNEDENIHHQLKLAKNFSLPQFINDPTRISPSESSTIYFWEAYATDEYIFVMSPNITQGDFISDNYGGSIILIFDWDGKPIKKIITDNILANLAIDVDNHLIYGMSDKNFDYLFRVPF